MFRELCRRGGGENVSVRGDVWFLGYSVFLILVYILIYRDCESLYKICINIV